MKRSLLAAALVAALAGCGNWLTGDDLATNPNQPTVANRDQLFVAFQTAQSLQYTSDLARTVCMWMQQCAGTDRQYKELGVYNYGEDAYNATFLQIYNGGGLLDIRKIEASADSANDAVYGGIARVGEALNIGIATDIWGDIPYSEAVTDINTPKLDPQQDVYAGIQAKLDTAITKLDGATGTGPGDADLIYGGDPQKWLRLAHTLKARNALHVAERNGNAAYQLALTEAQQGLQKGDDYDSFQADNPQSNNAWYQFVIVNRSGYLSSGARLVDLLKTRSDPRLPHYFAQNSAGAFEGADPGEQFSPTISPLSDERLAPGFHQPIVTWAENQFIIAEAAIKTGNAALALTSVNAVRQEAGLPALGSVTLTDVMTEKYIALFQNPEVWNDWKRTCLPALTPAAGNTTIPARLLYAQAERNTNPNIPLPGEQPSRNWNDPNGC